MGSHLKERRRFNRFTLEGSLLFSDRNNIIGMAQVMDISKGGVRCVSISPVSCTIGMLDNIELFGAEESLELTDLSGKDVILKGQSFGRAGFQRFQTIYSNVRAKRDAEDRAARTVVSLAPLLVAQALACWIVATQRKSRAWQEGVGTFMTMSVAASIALIGQTYHIPGNMSSFLLTWMVLTVPSVARPGEMAAAVKILPRTPGPSSRCRCGLSVKAIRGVWKCVAKSLFRMKVSGN